MDQKLLDKIPSYIDKYINMQCEQATSEQIREAINAVWKKNGDKPPEIVILPSPKACKDAEPDNTDFKSYFSYWASPYMATYEFATKEMDVELDKEKYDLFELWTFACPFIYYTTDKVYVSKKPVEIHFQDRVLHNESGMACKYEDGWGFWCLNGVRVNEQIVMRPETQTIEQLQNEENAEVKRIRIERYGWIKYLEKIDAKLIDYRDNNVEGTEEQLYSFNNGKQRALLCLCPSTGKEFVLEWDDSVNTCEEIQSRLSSGLSSRIISSS